MRNRTTGSDTRDQVMSGLKMVIDEAQRLLSKADAETTEHMSSTKDRFSSKMRDAQSNLQSKQYQVRESARDAAQTTGRYVKTNPWTAIGVGAAAGVLIGMMLGRK